MKVLDRGFVKLVDHMGSDLSPVNAARVSFGKRKEAVDEKDVRLLHYLAENEHTSPFRHTALQFHIKAPVFVLRQWMKHQVGCSWNEMSGRYITFKPEFFVPGEFRKQSKDNKQGSEGQIAEEHRKAAMMEYLASCRASMTSYEYLLSLGVCKEQARCVLPVSLYTECYWTASLAAVAHFIRLRTHNHAQAEITEFARAVEKITATHFPVSLSVLLP